MAPAPLATSRATSTRRTALSLAAGTLWYLPGRYGIARMLGSTYSLRCVLFHDISTTESVFTKGLGITVTPRNFEAALRFLVKHYNPVSLQDVLSNCDGHGLPPRPVLVTFDDGYVSAFASAAPLCLELGVPAVSFLNAACLDNRELALDNLICYIFNVLGMDAINAAVRSVDGMEGLELRSLTEVFTQFLPAISPLMRDSFRDALVESGGIAESDLARDAGLYVTSQQVAEMATFNCEVGNHTYTHVNCRCLSGEDFAREIDENKRALEAISGSMVRSFSVPYGSSADLTPNIAAHLERSGHEAVFLVESLANGPTDCVRLHRVSVNASSDATLFAEIEVLPRLRSLRNRLGFAKFQPHNDAPQLAQ